MGSRRSISSRNKGVGGVLELEWWITPISPWLLIKSGAWSVVGFRGWVRNSRCAMSVVSLRIVFGFSELKTRENVPEAIGFLLRRRGCCSAWRTCGFVRCMCMG